MKKIFEYNGHTFEISVVLNEKIERRIDGKRYHGVYIKRSDGFYYRSLEAETENLEKTIEITINNAKNWVDEPKLTKEEEILINLGFKKKLNYGKEIFN